MCPFITNQCSHGTWRCENSRLEPAKYKLPALVNLCQLNARLKEAAAARRFPRHWWPHLLLPSQLKGSHALWRAFKMRVGGSLCQAFLFIYLFYFWILSNYFKKKILLFVTEMTCWNKVFSVNYSAIRCLRHSAITVFNSDVKLNRFEAGARLQHRKYQSRIYTLEKIVFFAWGNK